MYDIKQFVNGITKKILEFMPHRPELVISNTLMCISVRNEYIDDEKVRGDFIVEIEKLFEKFSKNSPAETHDYAINVTDNFIVITACLL